jgi:flagellin
MNGISGQLYKAYQQLSTGKRINSAADDAAGLAIANQFEKQVRGLEVGTRNALDMQGLLRTAEGGLSTISDALTRVRELSIQAFNGINNGEDVGALQQEISQMIEHIDFTAKGVQFNNQNLLGGKFVDKLAATSPDGSGMTVSIGSMSAASLGISGYDVRKVTAQTLVDAGKAAYGDDFDLTAAMAGAYKGWDKVAADATGLSKIDDALSMVNSMRSQIGAQENRLDYTVNANETSYLNHMQALSTIADADMAKAYTRKNQLELLGQYATFMQTQQMRQKYTMLDLFR